MDHTLTRDAKKALATIYKAYKSRRASGEAKSSAVYFDTESHDATAIDAAVSDSLAELSNAKYVKTDICGNYTLTDSGIIFMENFARRHHKGMAIILRPVHPLTIRCKSARSPLHFRRGTAPHQCR